MRRRAFVALVGGVLVAPRLLAQKAYRIGFLGTAFASGYAREVEWIRSGLRDLGCCW